MYKVAIAKLRGSDKVFGFMVVDKNNKRVSRIFIEREQAVKACSKLNLIRKEKNG